MPSLDWLNNPVRAMNIYFDQRCIKMYQFIVPNPSQQQPCRTPKNHPTKKNHAAPWNRLEMVSKKVELLFFSGDGPWNFTTPCHSRWSLQFNDETGVVWTQNWLVFHPKMVLLAKGQQKNVGQFLFQNSAKSALRKTLWAIFWGPKSTRAVWIEPQKSNKIVSSWCTAGRLQNSFGGR